jgi:hypothetical protein
MAHSTARPLLVLQHIACEPPAAYEDELRAWGVELHRVEIDEAEPLPSGAGMRASSLWAVRWAPMRTTAIPG